MRKILKNEEIGKSIRKRIMRILDKEIRKIIGKEKGNIENKVVMRGREEIERLIKEILERRLNRRNEREWNIVDMKDGKKGCEVGFKIDKKISKRKGKEIVKKDIEEKEGWKKIGGWGKKIEREEDRIRKIKDLMLRKKIGEEIGCERIKLEGLVDKLGIDDKVIDEWWGKEKEK